MRHVEIDAPNLLIVRIYHDDLLGGLDEVERLEAIEMKARNAGRPTGGVRRKRNLSRQYLRVVLLHALHHPGLQNGAVAEIGDEIGGLLAGCGRLLIADAWVGGIAAYRTGSARDD